MKVNYAAVAKAIVILVFLTVLPIIGQRWVPQEIYSALSMFGGNLVDFLNRVAVVGIIFATLVAVRGHVAKGSSRHLALSTVWKVFWLGIVYFILGLGHPETLGFASLGANMGGVQNALTFDFSWVGVLSATVVALMVARSVLQFQEARSAAKNEAQAGAPGSVPRVSPALSE